MSYNLNLQIKNTARVRRLFVAALALGCAFGMVTHAHAQNIKSPTTPPIITPPAGNSAFLLGRGVGTQGYVCLPHEPRRFHHFLDRQWRSAGSRPFSDFLRCSGATKFALQQSDLSVSPDGSWQNSITSYYE